jgi:transposase
MGHAHSPVTTWNPEERAQPGPWARRGHRREAMTDIGKEALDAAQRFIDSYFDNPNTKRPEITIPAKETNTDLTLIRSIKALSARVVELEQQVRDTLKISNLKHEHGRLQGLDEAIDKCRQRDIIYADSAVEHIEALKGAKQ